MAKHPVPKKKVSQARTAMRYHAFAFKKKRKIAHFVAVSNCKKCGEPVLNQMACLSCGAYRDRSVFASKSTGGAKVTKIKV